MKLSPRLQLRQSQSLAMTPQLVQSIKLLQLSSQELADFVSDELERNPLLQISNEPHTESRRENQSELVTSGAADQNFEEHASETSDLVQSEMTLDAKKREEVFDTSFENVYDPGIAGAEHAPTSHQPGKEFQTGGSGSQLSQSEEGSFDLLSSIGEQQSLAQALETQIAYTFRSERDRMIAREIAYGLDEDGYFREDIKDSAERLRVNALAFTDVLEKFQTFEPAGIGARNLTECLALQLKEKNRFDPAMAALLANIELLAKRDFDALKKLCGVGTDDLYDMIREIKALDPRPASQHEPVLAEPVIPDVFVTQKPDGGWFIELNSDVLPKVLVNQEYHAELNQNVRSEEGKAFVADCLSNANWLVRSLDQRAQTILKVAMEIVKQQDRFFTDGVEYLRPLNLKDNC